MDRLVPPALKNAVFADRLSCHAFDSSPFRPLLHIAAYLLVFRLREQLERTGLATAQMDSPRLSDRTPIPRTTCPESGTFMIDLV